MEGQRVLFIGGQGPVSAPVLRALAPDNDVYAMARFTNPEVKEKLESIGVTCIKHDLFDPPDDLPTGFDYVNFSAVPMARSETGMIRTVWAPRGQWPDSYDKYPLAAGRLMAHFRGCKGFVFASTISVYDPIGDDTPLLETHPFGIHTVGAYAFTKVASEAVLTYVSTTLDIPTTILRVGSCSGVDGGPMTDRLDLLVQGKPIPVNADGPTYVRPIFEPDVVKLGIAALEAGRIPPLVVNWCGEDITTLEEYCTYFGQLIGRAPIFEPAPSAWPAQIVDTTFMHEVLGTADMGWQEGCRMLVEQRYPELLQPA